MSGDVNNETREAALAIIRRNYPYAPGSTAVLTVANLAAARLLSVGAATPTPEPEVQWADGLLNDGTYEYAESFECDGTPLSKWRRTPRKVQEYSAWESVDSIPSSVSVDKGNKQ